MLENLFGTEHRNETNKMILLGRKYQFDISSFFCSRVWEEVSYFKTDFFKF